MVATILLCKVKWKIHKYMINEYGWDNLSALFQNFCAKWKDSEYVFLIEYAFCIALATAVLLLAYLCPHDWTALKQPYGMASSWCCLHGQVYDNGKHSPGRRLRQTERVADR